MLKVIVNAWKIPELRKKMLFTLLIILIFRVGAAIPVPFLDIGEAGILTDASAGTFMEYLSMMTGDAFNYGTIFAMSITPYINSSIIMQLLTVAIPALERLSKEGEEGRKKIASITRYVTIALGLSQSTAYYIYLKNQGYLIKSVDGTAYTGFWMVFQAFVIIGTFVGGTALIMWLPCSHTPCYSLQPRHFRRLYGKRRRLLRACSSRRYNSSSHDCIHCLDG